MQQPEFFWGGGFPPLMVIVGWSTHGSSSNKTIVLFLKIRFLALKPKTQCINYKKLVFSILEVKRSSRNPPPIDL